MSPYRRNLFSLRKGMEKDLEIAVGAAFVPIRFPLVRILSETWFHTEMFTKEISGWGGGSNFDPQSPVD